MIAEPNALTGSTMLEKPQAQLGHRLNLLPKRQTQLRYREGHQRAGYYMMNCLTTAAIKQGKTQNDLYSQSLSLVMILEMWEKRLRESKEPQDV